MSAPVSAMMTCAVVFFSQQGGIPNGREPDAGVVLLHHAGH
jgi:hypothetical protein